MCNMSRFFASAMALCLRACILAPFGAAVVFIRPIFLPTTPSNGWVCAGICNFLKFVRCVDENAKWTENACASARKFTRRRNTCSFFRKLVCVRAHTCVAVFQGTQERRFSVGMNAMPLFRLRFVSRQQSWARVTPERIFTDLGTKV